jgi:hypothetical protein
MAKAASEARAELLQSTLDLLGGTYLTANTGDAPSSLTDQTVYARAATVAASSMMFESKMAMGDFANAILVAQASPDGSLMTLATVQRFSDIPPDVQRRFLVAPILRCVQLLLWGDFFLLFFFPRQCVTAVQPRRLHVGSVRPCSSLAPIPAAPRTLHR